MQRNLTNETQYALQKQPFILIINTVLGGCIGAFVGAVIHDFINLPILFAEEKYLKDHADHYDCTVTGNLFIDLKLNCGSLDDKNTFLSNTKIYGNTFANSFPISADYKIIGQCAMIGAAFGFYFGVKKADEIRLSTNPNTMYHQSSKRTWLTDETPHKRRDLMR